MKKSLKMFLKTCTYFKTQAQFLLKSVTPPPQQPPPPPIMFIHIFDLVRYRRIPTPPPPMNGTTTTHTIFNYQVVRGTQASPNHYLRDADLAGQYAPIHRGGG